MDIHGEIPFCNIRIDKEGVWYYKGAEMFRKEIVNFFYENLRQDASGHYLIELENDRCYLDVEDTAFVVRSVGQALSEKDGKTTVLYLHLSDDTTDALDPATLRIGTGNVLYCCVKNNRFEARFLRSAYYQLAGHIEYDEDQDKYFIPLDAERHYIRDDNHRQIHEREA
jgi:hypothetical protein